MRYHRIPLPTQIGSLECRTLSVVGILTFAGRRTVSKAPCIWTKTPPMAPKPERATAPGRWNRPEVSALSLDVSLLLRLPQEQDLHCAVESASILLLRACVQPLIANQTLARFRLAKKVARESPLRLAAIRV